MAETLLTEGSRTGNAGLSAADTADKATVLAAGDFCGSWDVRRVIVDHLSGAVQRFAGTVVISASDFIEAGEVRYGNVCLKASRRYGLRDSDANGVAGAIADGLAVAFPDGRSFIRLDGRASQAVHHLCGADDYRGRFFFRNGDAWVEAWRVAGPRKRYASLAHYHRQNV